MLHLRKSRLQRISIYFFLLKHLGWAVIKWPKSHLPAFLARPAKKCARDTLVGIEEEKLKKSKLKVQD